MHPPDWGRVSVESRAADTSGEQGTSLGDATRWGGQDTFNVLSGIGTYASQQLVRVDTEDLYSRNWQIIGNVSAPQDFWDAVDASPTDITIGLEVTMGVGQATVVQTFNLNALIALAADWYVDGASSGVVDGDAVPYIVKAWAISGGLIGKAISARIVVTEAIGGLEDDTPVTVVALLAPLANGVVGVK
jgi:hypothetical protein